MLTAAIHIQLVEFGTHFFWKSALQLTDCARLREDIALRTGGLLVYIHHWFHCPHVLVPICSFVLHMTLVGPRRTLHVQTALKVGNHLFLLGRREIVFCSLRPERLGLEAQSLLPHAQLITFVIDALRCWLHLPTTYFRYMHRNRLFFGLNWVEALFNRRKRLVLPLLCLGSSASHLIYNFMSIIVDMESNKTIRKSLLLYPFLGVI